MLYDPKTHDLDTRISMRDNPQALKYTNVMAQGTGNTSQGSSESINLKKKHMEKLKSLSSNQAPEKLLAVLGAAWLSRSHFNPKSTCF